MLIYRGDFNGRSVVVRERIILQSDQCSPERKEIIKVIRKTKLRLSNVAHVISSSLSNARRSLIRYWTTQTSSVFLVSALKAQIHSQ